MDLDATALDDLAATLTGTLLRPGDAGFDDARRGYQQRDPHRPDVVVRPADPTDVATALRFATAHDLPVAVQSSGHGRAAGLRGGLLVDTRDLTTLHVDAGRRTARAGAGVRWQQVLEAAGVHGLAPLSGSSPGVGVVGYTLGGGTGWLGRRYGYAADHVVVIELVTVDGTALTVTADSDPELFWALRGGGGSFGVVTAVEFALVEVAGVYGGGLTVDVAAHPDVLTRWRDWSAELPDDLTTALSLLTMPDVEPVPAPLRGRQIAAIQVAFTGSAAEGARLVAPLRDLDPISDTLRELPFADSGTISAEPDRPHAYRSGARLVTALPDRAVAAVLRASAPDAPVPQVVNLRRLGGGFARPPEVPNAVGHRDAAYAVYVLAAVDDDTADAARSLQETTLATFDDAGVALGTSLNFAYGPMSADDRRAAFDAGVSERLAAVARRCDPAGRLRANQPVR